MEVKSEKFTVNGKDFYFRWNVRARILFQKDTGLVINKDTDPEEIELSEMEAYKMAYYGTVAGMRKEGQPFDMSFDDFLDFIDMDLEPLVRLFERMTPKKQQDQEKKKRRIHH